jgi:signal transduction histidine kinase
VGLGLAIVSKIVDEHEGRIKVRSRAGNGTVFSIELPLGGAPLAELPLEQPI